MVGCASTREHLPIAPPRPALHWGDPSADPEVRPASLADDDAHDHEQLMGDVLPNEGVQPIDLAASLRLAAVVNPSIAEAQAALLEALANQTAARALLVPSLNAGANYHGHDGVLERASGHVIRLSEQSLYFGGGAYAYGSRSPQVPAVNIASPLADAIFEPLAARQRVAERRFDVNATGNEILRDVAIRHVDLMQATAEHEAQRQSERETLDVVRVTREYAEAGEGKPADHDRALAAWRLRRAQVLRAEEAVGVASARLSELLNLDPSIRLGPIGSLDEPIELAPVDSPTETLVREALVRRPEMASRGARVAEATARFRQEIARPWLPTVWLGFSGAGFGGGSNLAAPLVGNFAGRTDFDVRLFWTVLNLGAGNGSLQANRRAGLGRAEAERSQTAVQVGREVAEAQAEAKAARERVAAARRELATAEEGYRLDLERARENLARPIEVLNSVNLLANARINRIRAVADDNRQQYRLFVALGSPPPPPPPGPEPEADGSVPTGP